MPNYMYFIVGGGMIADARVRRDPAVQVHYLVKCTMHYHHHQMARQMASAPGTIVNSF